MDNKGVNNIKTTDSPVIKAPFDIVRELIKYSIDSESNIISVEIINGGITDITIADNGRGLIVDELTQDSGYYQPLHAIISESEIDIQTIDSRNKKQCRLRYFCGKELDSVPIDISEGTRYQIKNPFFQNHKKYKALKNDISEGNSIYNVIKHFVIGYPSISFRFISNGKTIFHSPGNNSIDDCLISIYNDYSFDSMKKIDAAGNGVKINCYISKREDKYNSNGDVFIYINGRPLSNINIDASIKEILRQMSVSRFIPVLLLNVSLDVSSIEITGNTITLSESSESDIIKIARPLLKDKLQKLSIKSNKQPDLYQQDIPILNQRRLPVNISVFPDLNEPFSLEGILFAKYLVIKQNDFIFVCNIESMKSLDISSLNNEKSSIDIVKKALADLIDMSSGNKRGNKQSSVICFSLKDFNSLFVT